MRSLKLASGRNLVQVMTYHSHRQENEYSKQRFSVSVTLKLSEQTLLTMTNWSGRKYGSFPLLWSLSCWNTKWINKQQFMSEFASSKTKWKPTGAGENSTSFATITNISANVTKQNQKIVEMWYESVEPKISKGKFTKSKTFANRIGGNDGRQSRIFAS